MSENDPRVYFDLMPGPAGQLLLVASADGLCRIGFSEGRLSYRIEPHWQHDPGILAPARQQLEAYFAGHLYGFDLPLAPQVSPFQSRVLEALRKVAYGTTVSYGELARRAGSPRGARAAGMAVARNPIPIIIPCHRVIGANGALTGFGGGLERKRWLLAHEQGLSAAATVSQGRQCAQAG